MSLVMGYPCGLRATVAARLNAEGNSVSTYRDPREVGAAPVIDYGTAPVEWVNGLARVDVMGSAAQFALYRFNTVILDGCERHQAEIVRNIVMPVEAVGPGIELTVMTFGPRLILPAAGYAMRKLVM